MEEDQLLTAKEVAYRVGVARETVYYWRRIGKLKAAGHEGKSVLFRLADVQALTDAMRIVYQRPWEANEE